MGYTILQWIGDEAVLNNFVAGLPTLFLIGIIVVSIALLSKGADWMIDGVVHLAERTGLPKIVIGATIVSLGTTMPEAFVSVMAAFMGNPGLALGNGVGSIIADTGLIFGLTCILAAVPVNRFILNRTGWVQVGSATLLVLISVMTLMLSSGSEPVLGRWVGVFFLLLLAGYMYATYTWARQSNALVMMAEEVHAEKEEEEELMGLGLCWTCIIGGLVLVVGGARVLIPSASQIAFRLGVPDDVIAANHGGSGHVPAGIDDRHHRHPQGASGDHGGQHCRCRRAQLPLCNRRGRHRPAPGDSAQLFLLPLPDHADHPVCLPRVHLHEQERSVQTLAGCLAAGYLLDLYHYAVRVEYRLRKNRSN